MGGKYTEITAQPKNTEETLARAECRPVGPKPDQAVTVFVWLAVLPLPSVTVSVMS